MQRCLSVADGPEGQGAARVRLVSSMASRTRRGVRPTYVVCGQASRGRCIPTRSAASAVVPTPEKSSRNHLCRGPASWAASGTSVRLNTSSIALGSHAVSLAGVARHPLAVTRKEAITFSDGVRADCPHDDDMRLAHFGHQSIFFGGVSCRDVIYGPQLRSLIDLRPGCIHHVLLRSAGRWPLIHHLGDLLPQFQTGVQITSEMDAGPQA